jgi:hypothetical protein
MNSLYKIVWEKWVDPFGADIDETKWNDYNEEDDNEDVFTDDEIKSKLAKPVRVISTPMGLIPYNEYTSSSKIFNFWVGHTNFNISTDITDIIEQCAGVEILDIFTRYRFRIGIGKCFTDSDTMNVINNNVYEYLYDQKHTD